ncbi:MAG: D-2-hydroxyacid dehydrogenase [Acidimicrobiales bacterium]
MDVVVATPIEGDLVDRIAKEVPGAVVAFEPNLLPPARYPADHRGDPAFRRDGAGERRWSELLAGAEVLLGIPGEDPGMLAGAVRSAPRLSWVQAMTAGAGQLVGRAGLSTSELERVTFTAAKGVHASQLAEWAMLGLLAFTKDLPRLVRDASARRWGHYPVRELAGQHLVVVGLGAIGREVARQAACLGMRVTGIRRHPGSPGGNGEGGRQGPAVEVRALADLEALVPAADAVVLALPLTTETAGLFDAGLIQLLPPHAVVVNVGRGGTLDEEALTASLAAGRIAGAALDVFADEPLAADSPLWTLPNVLVSPHTAALSVHENERIVEQFIRNCRRYLDGGPLEAVIDPRAFY